MRLDFLKHFMISFHFGLFSEGFEKSCTLIIKIKMSVVLGKRSTLDESLLTPAKRLKPIESLNSQIIDLVSD
jgi:hypothetical protein